MSNADLLTRICAYVAAVPTHYCKRCGTTAQSHEEGCLECEAIDRVGDLDVLPETDADALLREVAALEPIGYACIAWGNVQKLVRRDDVAGEFVTSHEIYDTAAPEVRPVYTLTGATHD